MPWVDAFSVGGTLGTFVFGYISLKQKSEIDSLKGAIRAHAQSTYNAWWYVGVQAESLKKGQVASEMHLPASEINGISQAVRSQVIAFGREYAGEAPSYEPAWKPRVDGK